LKIPQIEECRRYVYEEWAETTINRYQIEKLEDGSPIYGLPNINDGRFSCFGAGPWNYAVEIGCEHATNPIYTGRIPERELGLIPSSIDCVRLMEEMVSNSNGTRDDIFLKVVESKDGGFKEVCYQVRQKQSGPIVRECNATMSAARFDAKNYWISKEMNGRIITYSAFPTWQQFEDPKTVKDVYVLL